MTEDDNELHLNNEVHQATHADLKGQNEDRLPWLEAVEPDADHVEHSRSNTTGVLLAALGALAVLLAGLWWMNTQAPPPKAVDNKLIAANEGDYKTKPADVGGMKIAGQGDSAAATAGGQEQTGKIDTASQAEAPVKPAADAKPMAESAPIKPNAVAKIASVNKATATASAAAVPLSAAPAAAMTGLVQLGAYGSEASAKTGWAKLKLQYNFLAAMPESIVSASIGGNTVYRLRAATGDAASETCAKLKAAGTNCLIVH